MKTSILMSVIGFILFVVSVIKSIDTNCFHCKKYFVLDPLMMMLSLVSLIILSAAFVRLLKTMEPLQLNSYNAVSLIESSAYESQVSFPPQDISTEL